MVNILSNLNSNFLRRKYC